MFANLRIATKLSIGFGFVALLITLIAAIAWIQLGGAKQLVEDALEDRYPKIESARNIRGELTAQALQLREALLSASTGDSAAVATALTKVEESSTKASKDYDKLRATINTPKGKELLPKYVAGMDKLESIERAQAIGTYDLSIIPVPDSCTVFAPPAPAVAAKFYLVEEEEKKIPGLNDALEAAFKSIEKFEEL